VSTAGTGSTIELSWGLRRPERQLLLLILLAIALGFLMMLGSGRAAGRALSGADLLPFLTYGASLLLLHGLWVLARFRGDQVLPALVALLAGLGLLAQYRMGLLTGAEASHAARLALPAGVLLMGAIAVVGAEGRYGRLVAGRYAIWGWAGLSVLLLAVLLLTGHRFRGGVYAAGFVTPSELLKVTMVLFVAGFIDQQVKALKDLGTGLPIPPWRALLPLAGLWAALTVLLLIQRDLGMLIILSTALIAMLALGTGRLAYLIYGATAAAALGYLLLRLFAHGQGRLRAWQAPFEDPTGGSWQILQGLSGMFAGGLWGEGFGRGNPEYTPIAQSDFIYAVLGEELGFAGCVLVVALFLVLILRGLEIAYRTRSSFGSLLAAGLTTVIAVQTFLNIGGVTKSIPLTGVTLPFVSHGGSSLLTAFASVGLLLAISAGEPAKGRSRTHAPAKTAPSGRPRRGAPQPPPQRR
jgi:cell division protein FtsW (lipid II flippase)